MNFCINVNGLQQSFADKSSFYTIPGLKELFNGNIKVSIYR